MVNTAVQRAAHQLLDDRPLIFDDPLAVGLVPEASATAIRAAETELQTMKVGRAAMALRSRFAEDRLEAAVRRGVRQYVIGAAGLDTFPWRQPNWARDVRIYFSDIRESLDWTLQQLRERGLEQPVNTTFVASNLEQRRLGHDLAAHGFDPQAPVFCSALGIIQFLTAEAVESLLGFVASSAPGSELVLSCHPPAEQLEGGAQVGIAKSIERGAKLGERWLTLVNSDEMASRIRRAGFKEVEHLSPEAAQARYFAGRKDGLFASRGLQLFSAQV